MELLCSVAIVAILVALVSLAVWPKIKDQALLVQCSSNLRQIGMSFQSYAADNENRLPQRFYPGPAVGYDELLLPYAKGGQNIFRCPVSKNNSFPIQPSYGMNWYYDNASLLAIDHPATTILVAEAYQSATKGSHRADREGRAPGAINSKLHEGRSNYLFVDGHLELLDRQQTLEPDLWGSDQERHSEPLPDTYVASQ